MRSNSSLFNFMIVSSSLLILCGCPKKPEVNIAQGAQNQEEVATRSKKGTESELWAQQGSYPPRQGNEIQILIDGQDAYGEISRAFHDAKEFIYVTISYGDQDFLLIPETKETMFDIFRARQKAGVDVRMVVWQPADLKTQDTITYPPKTPIPGVNDGPGSIQARWDEAKGYKEHPLFPPGQTFVDSLDYPPLLGCHHQKTYVMDDGKGGVVAFVGGINPVQAYWDTTAHDSLDARRVAIGIVPPIKGLEEKPPLHDVFYKIKGPAVGDVLANFIERYNGANIRLENKTTDAEIPFTAKHIPPVPGGMEIQVLRTIAPDTYPGTKNGDRGIREFYLNALRTAGEGSLVYIENQYFFDYDVISEIHEAAERGAKIIAILESTPDEGTLMGDAEKPIEDIAWLMDASRMVKDHQNVALLTLGNSRPDPRMPGKMINSETYVHSKNMAVFGPTSAVMTGGSANIAFTSMLFHSEMNVAFMDTTLIKKWVAQLWSEHLGIALENAMKLIEKPEDAFNFFKEQARHNTLALQQGLRAEGHVYEWGHKTTFPKRELNGINPGAVTKINP
jgi:phosphatidylserine/phosphatidylglycerophosphate/cardiolipin synthase-like enzyme